MLVDVPSMEGLGRFVDEVERCPKRKAFFRATAVLAGGKNAWLEAFPAVRIQSHTPKAATRKVAEAAQTRRSFPESRKITLN